MGTNARRRLANRREVVILIVALIAVLVGGYALSERMLGHAQASVRFVSAEGESKRFSLEVADTEAKRQLGLMYRKEMAADRGMIFVFPEDKIQRFWMKNTYIPLDIIFVDAKWEVVGVVNDVPPLTLEQRAVDTPSRYVIELRAGMAAAQGIKKGSKAMVEGLSKAS